MISHTDKKSIITRTFISFLSIFIMIIGMLTASVNQFLSGLILILGAVFVYFISVIKLSNRNYLDFVSVFSAVWIGTIGLAQLRLLDYQKIWETRTWLNLILTIVVLHLGIPFGHFIGKKILNIFSGKKEIQFGRIYLSFKKERVFWICIIITVIVSVLFLLNVKIKGYVPFFSTMFNAYSMFYTRLMVFVTAGCATSPIAYWCIKKCNLSSWQKICLYLCIIINTFAIPILQVNRGVFIVAALMLTASIFFLNKRNFWVLCCCIVVTFGFFEVGSVARKYTNEYLNSVFEPSEFEVTLPNNEITSNVTENISTSEQTSDEQITSESVTENEPTESVTENEPTQSVTEGNSEEQTEASNETSLNKGFTFRLPAKLSFLYGYFTVSHDNFNEAVLNASDYTYGLRQLKPFNVIFRIDRINEIINNSEFHILKHNLNTANLISTVYYDLREFGVALFVFLWSSILGAIEIIYLKHKGVFALAALGNCLTPIALCFFSSWFDNFTFWLLWGTILIIMFVSIVNILPKKKTIRR